ncbi:MAG: hypothetical protein EZS28_038698 [Streblomastix strix]|uniref:Uncharacterized protein n=1 Tax=Streblomastix strix TaxID=222440 RepID=A0A5J4U7Q9_9EUKA|nr:MAG: hypothetical protein EZS28_038698 [Streblomastix strix]
MYDADWYNSGDIVPDQVTPASDATPLSDGTATAGISTEYSRGDHVHPLNVTSTIPISDSASGSVGTTNYYARNDHSHPLNISTTIPPQDSANGSVGTTNYYARNDHSHPINVETNASNIPIVNGVGANGSSAFYARQDHVHPQQLTYDGNVTATKFIKAGGLTTEVLCANGDTKAISDIVSNYVDLTTNQTITGVKTFDSFKKTGGTANDILLADGSTKQQSMANNSIEFQVDTRSGFGKIQFNQHWSNGTGISTYQYKFIPSLVTSLSSAWIIYFDTGVNRYGELCAGVFQGQITNILTTDGQTDSPTGYSTNYSQGLRISRITSGCGIYLGTSSQINGTVQNQWQIVSQPDNFDQNALGLTIGLSSESGSANRGLCISADGNTLSFNGSVIAGVGATNGATNGSVNYSAGNPILWGVNSTDPIGGFYSNGTNIYWRARAITLGSVPP